MSEKTLTPAELIKSDAFEAALNEGATYKQEILTTYKTQNKDNYKRFQEIMYENNAEIKEILAKKKKNRTDDDNKKLQDFKNYVATLYNQTTDLIVTEKLEEGKKKSKVEKIIDKILPVFEMLSYIDNNVLEKELNKRGFNISGIKLENRLPSFDSDDKKSIIKDIFNTAKLIKEKVNADNEYIETEIYQGKVPIDLQYDKQGNNSGLKPGDFKKLVDIKTKLNMAKTDEAKEKVEDKIEHIAGEKQFEISRAELVRDSLTNMQ